MAANLSPADAINVVANSRMNTGPFTLSLWIKTTQATSNIAIANRHGTPSSNRGFTTLMNNGVTGRMQLNAKTSGGVSRLALSGVGSTMANGSWHHLAIVYYLDTTANGNKVYVDGALDVQGASSGAWDCDPTADYKIGRSVDSFWGQFGDDLAESAYYDAELTATEIAALAKGFRPTRVRPQNMVSYQPLVRGFTEVRGNATTSSAANGGFTDHPRVF